MGLFNHFKGKDNTNLINCHEGEKVPEFLKFATSREMPIARIPGPFSYSIFPSVHSFELFKARRPLSLEDCLFDENGMGIPLLVMKEPPNYMPDPLFFSPTYQYEIHCYEIRTITDPPPYQKHELVSSMNTHKLYLTSYASVCQTTKSGRYHFDITIENKEDSPVSMIGDNSLFLFDTSISGHVFRWTQKIFALQTKIKLTLVNDQFPTFFDSDAEFKHKMKNRPSDVAKFSATIGQYARKESAFFRKVRKVGTLSIGEDEENISKLGLDGCDEYKKLFAIEALLIHFVTDKRDTDFQGNNSGLINTAVYLGSPFFAF